MRVEWKGVWDYTEALEEQLKTNALVADGDEEVIFGCEHPEVITLGVQGSNSDLTFDPAKEARVRIEKVRRGGHATLHSPGQLVIYPIINLKERKLGVRDFVCLIEKTTQEFLKHFGKNTYRKQNDPGLYTDKGKVAFFGIQVKKWTSLHGISINIRNDVSLFQNIVSCGIQNEQFDTVGDGREMGALFDLWIECFQNQN